MVWREILGHGRFRTEPGGVISVEAGVASEDAGV